MKTTLLSFAGTLMFFLVAAPLHAQIESNVVIQLKVYNQQAEVPNGDLRSQSYQVIPYNTAAVAQMLAAKEGKLVSNKALLIRQRDVVQYNLKYLIRDKGQNDIDVTDYFLPSVADQARTSKRSFSKGTYQTRIFASGAYDLALNANQEGFYLKGPMQLLIRGVTAKQYPGQVLEFYSENITGIGHCITSPNAGRRLVTGTIKYTPPRLLKAP